MAGKPELVPLSEVLPALGGHAVVRRAIASGALDAEKLANRWHATRDELRAFARRTGGPDAVAKLDAALLRRATWAGVGEPLEHDDLHA
jgi:hypothetical protein